MLNRIRLVAWMWVGILGSAGMKTVIFHFLVGESGYTKLRIPSLVCTCGGTASTDRRSRVAIATKSRLRGKPGRGVPRWNLRMPKYFVMHHVVYCNS